MMGFIYFNVFRLYSTVYSFESLLGKVTYRYCNNFFKLTCTRSLIAFQSVCQSFFSLSSGPIPFLTNLPCPLQHSLSEKQIWNRLVQWWQHWPFISTCPTHSVFAVVKGNSWNQWEGRKNYASSFSLPLFYLSLLALPLVIFSLFLGSFNYTAIAWVCSPRTQDSPAFPSLYQLLTGWISALDRPFPVPGTYMWHPCYRTCSDSTAVTLLGCLC